MKTVLVPTRKGPAVEPALRVGTSGYVYFNALLGSKMPSTDHDRYRVEIEEGPSPKLHFIPDPAGYQSFRQSGTGRTLHCHSLPEQLPPSAVNTRLSAVKVGRNGTVTVELPS